MGAYRVLSPQQQREGGQGVVQFMRWAHGGAGGGQVLPVTVEIWQRDEKKDIKKKFAEVWLCSMMPVMREAVRGWQAWSRRGYVFPAFVVL